MKQYLFLCIALAATVCKASAQQKAVEQICITVDSMLNAQRKVTAHITMDGYDGPIGIKLRGNSSLGFNQKKYTIELRDEQDRERAAGSAERVGGKADRDHGKENQRRTL